MARFDVYANPDPADRKQIPYLLDVQNEFLQLIDTRVVVPLRTRDALRRGVERLNPELEVGGQRVVMDTAAIAAIPATSLHHPIANLGRQRLAIQDAMDTLFGSY